MVIHSEAGVESLVAAFYRLCIADVQRGPAKVGQHYWTARQVLESLGWIDEDGQVRYAGAKE